MTHEIQDHQCPKCKRWYHCSQRKGLNCSWRPGALCKRCTGDGFGDGAAIERKEPVLV